MKFSFHLFWFLDLKYPLSFLKNVPFLQSFSVILTFMTLFSFNPGHMFIINSLKSLNANSNTWSFCFSWLLFFMVLGHIFWSFHMASNCLMLFCTLVMVSVGFSLCLSVSLSIYTYNILIVYYIINI